MFLCLVGVLQVYIRFYESETSGGALNFLPVVKVSKQVKSGSHDVTHEMMVEKVPSLAVHRHRQTLGDKNDWLVNSTISALRQLSHGLISAANNNSLISGNSVPQALRKLRPSVSAVQ